MSLLRWSRVAGSSLSLGLCYRAPHSDEIVVEFDGPLVPILESGGWFGKRHDIFLKDDGKGFSEVFGYHIVLCQLRLSDQHFEL